MFRNIGIAGSDLSAVPVGGDDDDVVSGHGGGSTLLPPPPPPPPTEEEDDDVTLTAANAADFAALIAKADGAGCGCGG